MRAQDAVLNIVAGGPAYGSEIARELEEEWSSAAVYRALAQMREEGLIEPTTAEDRRGKPYRATRAGLKLNARRIIKSLDSRHEMLSTLLRSEGNTAAVLDALEQRLLADIRAEPARHPDVFSELLWMERRAVNGARLRWVAFARGKIGNALD